MKHLSIEDTGTLQKSGLCSFKVACSVTCVGRSSPIYGLLSGQSIYHLGSWTLRDLGLSKR